MRSRQSSIRIDALLFGGVDMAAELRVEADLERAAARAEPGSSMHAASAGVDLIDVPFLDLNDMAGLGDRGRALAPSSALPARARSIPSSWPVITRHFTPSAEQVARAKRITQAFGEARTGLVVVDGKLIERPVLRSMQRLVAIADAAGRRAKP